ncbi:inositol monophosphatase [Limibacillus sp. MBR-115]|jgi:fructose-1,6-bisphosphatase/inositol monophosphatase family enzyme|uniref:inositol monophosphatase family protein n=1 Tax=Limibacillus sp. MBR-115 TaxID=3156465 RepID=UPI003399DCD9
MKIHTQSVIDILKETAETEVMPRYQTLASHEIREKDKGEPVTVADEASERRLTAALTALLPGSKVVGEEAAATDPKVFDLLAGAEPVWIVDPIDGTRNFSHGRPVFAIMVALVRAGETVGAWILELPSGRMAVAEKGAGAWMEGVRLKIAPAPSSVSELTGTFHASTWASPEIAKAVERNRDRMRPLKSLGCAGAEYLRLSEGKMHFSLFTKLMPWDHAPGTLIHAEAGGLARTLEQVDYHPLLRQTQGLVMAPDEATWQTLSRVLTE